MGTATLRVQYTPLCAEIIVVFNTLCAGFGNKRKKTCFLTFNASGHIEILKIFPTSVDGLELLVEGVPLQPQPPV